MSTSPDKTPNVTIYADGACERNPGRGGWAAIVREDNGDVRLSGGYQRTTNNRMEIMAVLEGLRSLGETRKSVLIISDSRYVVDAIDKGWLKNWIRARFIKPDGTPRDNADLWRQMHALIGRHNVRTKWIRGHAGHAENEECDRMAVAARHRPALAVDHGYATPGFASPLGEQTALSL